VSEIKHHLIPVRAAQNTHELENTLNYTGITVIGDS